MLNQLSNKNLNWGRFQSGIFSLSQKIGFINHMKSLVHLYHFISRCLTDMFYAFVSADVSAVLSNAAEYTSIWGDKESSAYSSVEPFVFFRYLQLHSLPLIILSQVSRHMMNKASNTYRVLFLHFKGKFKRKSRDKNKISLTSIFFSKSIIKIKWQWNNTSGRLTPLYFHCTACHFMYINVYYMSPKTAK